MLRNTIRTAAVAAGIATAAGLAFAENYGRVTEPNEVVRTSLFPLGDADDMVFDAGAGWTVQASMKVKGQVVLPPPPEGQEPPVLTALAPVLELVAPDGSVETVGVVAKASKKAATLKAVLGEGGRFALRLRGSAGTGIVELKWKLKPGKTAPVKNVVLEPNTNTDFEFSARGGAVVSWKLAFKGDGAAQVDKILDPDGVEVPFDPLDETYITRNLTSEVARNIPLPVGRPGGQYRLRVVNKIYSSTMSLSIKVALPKVPAVPVTLTREEPVLTDIGRNDGGCGIRISLTGVNLDSSPQGVLFGSAAALSVDVAQGSQEQDPDTCSVTIPGGSGLVDVIFVAADGQRAVLPDAFTFSPLPVITSFTPDVGPGAGNITLTVKGTGFEYPSQGLYKIIIREGVSGGVPCSNVQVVDANTLVGKIPAYVSGPKQVLVRNLCNEDSIAPGFFTYAITLNISNVIPDAVPTFGGIPVVVYGTNFQDTNQVYLDGNPVPTTPVYFTGVVIGHRIAGADLPAHVPGKVDVEVRQGMTSSTKPGGLAYYTFTDVTASAVPEADSNDDWGAVSTGVADINADGKTDYIILTHSTALNLPRPGTRILKNDGTGVFTDGTGTLMPFGTSQEGLGGNTVLVADFQVQTGVPKFPDIYLSRPGTGTEARRTSDNKFVDAWGVLLFGSAGQGYTVQPKAGGNSKLSIAGTLTYSKCFIYDYDYRSVSAALGDLDNDLDQDIVLVNDTSIASFTGVNCNYRWQTCAGGYYASCYTYSKNPLGSALRLCTVSSSGSVFDRTLDFLKAGFSSSDDFRGVAVAVGDMNNDALGLTDIVVTHDTYPGAGLASCTRLFQQKQTNLISTFVKFQSGFLPAPGSGSDDDWRGNAVVVPDLNSDLFRDMIIGYDDVLPTGRPYSTRILVQDSVNGKLVDRTETLLAGLLPAGDYGRSKFILAHDVDSDGDRDIIITTRNSTGTGNPKTRLLLNIAKDDVTGLPTFINATSILPVNGADDGAAVSIVPADIDGDGDLDLIVTDERDGNPTRKTRIWRQDR